jgi:hypothetical protein
MAPVATSTIMEGGRHMVQSFFEVIGITGVVVLTVSFVGPDPKLTSS